MNSNTFDEITQGMELLYKTTVELYENYFKALEAAIQNTPLSEVEKLTELRELAKEASEAMDYDLAIFDKAIANDTEAINNMAEQLKIQEIYTKLQK